MDPPSSSACKSDSALLFSCKSSGGIWPNDIGQALASEYRPARRGLGDLTSLGLAMVRNSKVIQHHENEDKSLKISTKRRDKMLR